MSNVKSVHVVVTGRVQGVFYRRWTQERARTLGVSGWVRNREDGAVEAVLSGAGSAVDALLTECRDGPPAARVEAVNVREADPVEGPFEVRS